MESKPKALLFPTQLFPTPTEWVMKDPEGRMARIRVRDMTDSHLWRWIRYFRRKRRDAGFTGTDAQLDEAICESIITAPAIFAEAIKRGAVPGLKRSVEPRQVTLVEEEAVVVPAKHGERKIELE